MGYGRLQAPMGARKRLCIVNVLSKKLRMPLLSIDLYVSTQDIDNALGDVYVRCCLGWNGNKRGPRSWAGLGLATLAWAGLGWVWLGLTIHAMWLGLARLGWAWLDGWLEVWLSGEHMKSTGSPHHVVHALACQHNDNNLRMSKPRLNWESQ